MALPGSDTGPLAGGHPAVGFGDALRMPDLRLLGLQVRQLAAGQRAAARALADAALLLDLVLGDAWRGQLGMQGTCACEEQDEKKDGGTHEVCLFAVDED